MTPPDAPPQPTAALLTAEQAALVDDERAALAHLLALLEGADSTVADLDRLRAAAAGLAELFLLVVAGEFNAGKSAFINAMLGGRFLEEGVTPTTAQVQLLAFGDPAPPRRDDGFWRHSVPAPVLQGMHIVDTPGTNAILREHEALTRDFVPRADLVLFVTSADRPFTESERAFLEAIRAWGKKIVIVLNKIDLLAGEDERSQVMSFVRDGARTVLGAAPELFAVSARDALRAQTAGDSVALEQAGWPPFASWLHESLTAGERLRLKLENPLGVARRVAGEATTETAARLAVLAGDRAVLDDVARAMSLYESDLADQFERRLDTVDKRVLELRGRGEAFLDERFRLTRLRGLLDSDRLRADFEREVIADTPEAIERDVGAMVDWLIDREYAQWQVVRDRLAERASAGLQDAARKGGTEFGARRQSLLASVGREAETLTDRFDPRVESQRLAQDVKDAIASTALVEAGALGLGLILKALLVTAMEPTGMLAAGVVAAIGLSIIPLRRRKAAESLRERTETLRESLRANLTTSFQRETQLAIDRMQGAVEPYGRFVRAESEQLELLAAELASIQADLATLGARVAAVTG